MYFLFTNPPLFSSFLPFQRGEEINFLGHTYMCAGAVYRSIYIINLRRNKAKIGERKKFMTREELPKTANTKSVKKNQNKFTGVCIHDSISSSYPFFGLPPSLKVIAMIIYNSLRSYSHSITGPLRYCVKSSRPS